MSLDLSPYYLLLSYSNEYSYPEARNYRISHFDQAMSLTPISDVTKCTHFLRFTNLAFFQEFFRVGKIYCYANFFHYANFSIVFGPNFGGGQTASGGGGLSGTKPANSVTAVVWVIMQTHLSTLVHIQCRFNVHSSLFSNH